MSIEVISKTAFKLDGELVDVVQLRQWAAQATGADAHERAGIVGRLVNWAYLLHRDPTVTEEELAFVRRSVARWKAHQRRCRV